MKHVLFPVDELKPGEMRAVTVDNLALVIIKTPTGELRALRDSCSHFGAKLSAGKFQPMIVGDHAGEHRIEKGKFVIRCPWHGYTFDVDNGLCHADPRRARVRSYDVSVEDNRVVVER